MQFAFLSPFANKQIQPTIKDNPCSTAMPGQPVTELEQAPQPLPTSDLSKPDKVARANPCSTARPGQAVA